MSWQTKLSQPRTRKLLRLCSLQIPFPEPYIESAAQTQSFFSDVVISISIDKVVWCLLAFEDRCNSEHVHNVLVVQCLSMKFLTCSVIAPVWMVQSQVWWRAQGDYGWGHEAGCASGSKVRALVKYLVLPIKSMRWDAVCFNLNNNQDSVQKSTMCERWWFNCKSICVRFCHRQFELHARKWMHWCQTQGKSAQEAMRFLNQAGLWFVSQIYFRRVCMEGKLWAFYLEPQGVFSFSTKLLTELMFHASSSCLSVVRTCLDSVFSFLSQEETGHASRVWTRMLARCSRSEICLH